jgi:hypothetical protein
MLMFFSDDLWRAVGDCVAYAALLPFSGTCKKAHAAVKHRLVCFQLAKSICSHLSDYFVCKALSPATAYSVAPQSGLVHTCTITASECSCGVWFDENNVINVEVAIGDDFFEDFMVVVESELTGQLVYNAAVRRYSDGNVWFDIKFLILSGYEDALYIFVNA